MILTSHACKKTLIIIKSSIMQKKECRRRYLLKNRLTNHGNTWCITNVYNWVEPPCCSSPYKSRILLLSRCQSPRVWPFQSHLYFCTVFCRPLSVCGHPGLWYPFLVVKATEISQLFHNTVKPISIKANNQLVTKTLESAHYHRNL